VNIPEAAANKAIHSGNADNQEDTMTNDNQAITVQPGATFLAPAASLAQLRDRYQIFNQFVKDTLHPGVDFQIIPGTDKPSLVKPGAEKLAALFGLSARFSSVTRIEDWTGEEHGGEPLFYYVYNCELSRGDLFVASCDGSCNSREKKYRYRNADRVCPNCNKPTIIKGKEEYGGGWICFAKKGGCGAKFKDSDPKIASQQVGQVINPDIADVINTIQKMAQKRAFVGAVLIATNASEYFTQDIEDMPGFVDATFTEAPRQSETKPTPPPQPENSVVRVDIPAPSAASVRTSNITDAAPEQKPAPTNGNGHARPMSPEVLKKAITAKAGKHAGENISAGAKGLMVGQLNALFGGDENKRHQLTMFLTGYGSTKQMPSNVCQSIMDWIGSDDEMAKREANAAIAFLDGQNGQLKLA
jgi:hypothetical protein